MQMTNHRHQETFFQRAFIPSRRAIRTNWSNQKNGKYDEVNFTGAKVFIQGFSGPSPQASR